MLVGIKEAINAPVILLLFSIAISSANILTDAPKNNPLGIDWDPAPSPEDGPPLSAGASRDKSLLPAQIGGILGAYLVSVCIVGIALIFIGRRLRLAVLHSAKNLDIEMVQPHFNNIYGFDPSPVSPAEPGGPRNFSWPSPDKDTRNPYIYPTTATGRSPTSPAGAPDFNVDNRVVEADREMLQRDLEDIYAHVMEQEEAKAKGIAPAEMPPPPQLQSASRPPNAAPQRQATPKKIEKPRPGVLNIDEAKSPKSNKSRASSIISSLRSPGRRKDKGVRGMQISSPIPTPVSATFPGAASDEEPLTPRYYTPPPPPPVPTDQVPYTHSRNTSNVSANSPVRSIAEQLSMQDLHSQQRHRANYSQASARSSGQPDPVSAISTTSQSPLFVTVPNPKSTPVPASSANSSSRALPFRQFEPALASPSFTSVKTTVLERTTPKDGGPKTGGLRTPFTAGAVPYSPYQPFTPMMPITPRLVTKEDRKAAKKKQGKVPVTELIKSEDELWDSGY